MTGRRALLVPLLLLPLLLVAASGDAAADDGCASEPATGGALCWHEHDHGDACDELGQDGAHHTRAWYDGPHARANVGGARACQSGPDGERHVYAGGGASLAVEDAERGDTRASVAWWDVEGEHVELRGCAYDAWARSPHLPQDARLTTSCPLGLAPPDPGWGRRLP